MTNDPDELCVGLADAVRAVRAELQAAMADGAGEDLRFEVGPVEVEFAIDLRKERRSEANAKVLVLSLGTKGSAAMSRTHRMCLTLHPRDALGNTPLVNSNVPVIPES
ncbi:trypco2 family protein [Streptomyces niveus]|uniref:trypco2 family protein n=1 Tax=Streptomyces niveus TaxID=193462 RepID=UPI003659C1DE